MGQIANIIKNPPWDAVLVFMIVVAGFFWGVTEGKKKLSLVIVGIYILHAIFPFVPFNGILAGRSPEEIWMFKAIAFFIALVILLLFLMRTFKGAVTKGEGAWWEILLLSLLAAGLFIVSLASLAPSEVFQNNALGLSSMLINFFTSPSLTPWLVALPILGILFF